MREVEVTWSMSAGISWKKKVISSEAMWAPSTSASVMRMILS